VTPVRRKPSLDFSVTGLVYCSMMMFMGLAAINSQANLLFGVFGLMIGVLLVSGSVSKLVLRKLAIERVLPETASVGQATTLTYHFTNNKRLWPSLSISLGELDGTEAFTSQPFCYMLHTAPAMAASVPIEVMPKRRGLHTLDRYQISTSFPFGFIKRAVINRKKDSLLVYPAVAQVDPKLLTLCRSADKSGAMIRPRQGGNDEFYGLKEFRQGQNPRHIYWKRSAKTGVLVSKEMTQVSPPRLMLLVDTYVPDRTVESHAAVERAIAMAASLASHGLEAGLLVGAVVWDNGWIKVAPGRGKRQRRDLLALFGRLPLNTTQNTLALLAAAQDQLDTDASPVLLSPQELAMSMGGQLRTGMLALSSTAHSGTHWFRFDREVNFEHSMPPDQEPPTGRAARTKAPAPPAPKKPQPPKKRSAGATV
jgi:uncharacterized protein (DUF58 family)